MKRDALKVASITLISVAVVSKPVKAHQSFTTRPAPITSEPRFTVPACHINEKQTMHIVSITFQSPSKVMDYVLTTRGTWSKLLSSSWSWTLVFGCTRAP